LKHLTLIRHAKSSWSQAPLGDFERPLNERGQRDAPEMGQRLASLGFVPDVMLVSPARRALDTARAIAQRIGRSEDEIRLVPALYGAATTTLLREIQELSDEVGHAAIVAHNPGLTDLCNLLTSDWIDNIPTCGVVRLRLTIERWAEAGEGTAARLDFDHPRREPRRDPGAS